MDGTTEFVSAEADVRDALQDACDENNALRAELATLSTDADRMRAALETLRDWSNAYPLTVFPEPDFMRAHELLSAVGMSLDAISASNMRHVIEQTRKIVDDALQDAE